MKLIAIDMDGTLLSSDCTISNFNRQAIVDVQKQGNMVVISSGRSLHDTKEILKLAGIDCPTIITGNGALIYHSGSVLQQLTISASILTELVQLLEKHNLYYEVYTNQGIVVHEDRKEVLNEEIEGIQGDSAWAKDLVDIQYSQHHLRFIKNDQELAISKLDPYKVFVFSFDKQKLDLLKEMVSSRADISITTSGAQKLEIGHVNASKGNALLFLADYLNVSLANTVAIGDNLNDVSMFDAAGVSIAMGNAEEEVKEKANYITTHCNDDGVGHALRKYIIRDTH